MPVIEERQRKKMETVTSEDIIQGQELLEVPKVPEMK
jgi:hypothetical protein